MMSESGNGNKGPDMAGGEKSSANNGFGGSRGFWNFFRKNKKKPIEAYHCENGKPCECHTLHAPKKVRRKILKVIPFFGHKYSPCGYKNCGNKKPPFYRRPMFLLFMAGLAFEGFMISQAYQQISSSFTPVKPTTEAIRIADAHPTTSSKYVQELKERFERPYDDMAIFFTDPDRLVAYKALNMGKGTPEQQQAGAIAAMVKEDTGIDITAFLGTIAHEVRNTEGGISALPIRFDELFGYGVENTAGDQKIDKLCILTPVAELTSGMKWMSLLAQLPEPAIKALGRDGKIGVTPQAMQRYIDYHETTHCHDRKFAWANTRFELAKANLSHKYGVFKDEDAPSIVDYAYVSHQAEMFADVNASLMMAAEGETELASKMADARASYSYMIGAAGAQQDIYAGAMYFTTPGLRAAQELIDEMGQEALAKLTIHEKMELAYDIVDKNRLSREAFGKLIDLQKRMEANPWRLLDGVLNENRFYFSNDKEVQNWLDTTANSIRHIADKDYLLGPSGPAPMRLMKAWDKMVSDARQPNVKYTSFEESLTAAVSQFKDRVRQEIRDGKTLDPYDSVLYARIDDMYIAHMRKYGNRPMNEADKAKAAAEKAANGGKEKAASGFRLPPMNIPDGHNHGLWVPKGPGL